VEHLPSPHSQRENKRKKKKKKKKKKKVPSQAVHAAMAAVRAATSVRAAAKEFGVPRTSLARLLKSSQVGDDSHRGGMPSQAPQWPQAPRARERWRRSRSSRSILMWQESGDSLSKSHIRHIVHQLLVESGSEQLFQLQLRLGHSRCRRRAQASGCQQQQQQQQQQQRRCSCGPASRQAVPSAHTWCMCMCRTTAPVAHLTEMVVCSGPAQGSPPVPVQPPVPPGMLRPGSHGRCLRPGLASLVCPACLVWTVCWCWWPLCPGRGADGSRCSMTPGRGV